MEDTYNDITSASLKALEQYLFLITVHGATRYLHYVTVYAQKSIYSTFYSCHTKIYLQNLLYFSVNLSLYAKKLRITSILQIPLYS